MKSEPVPFIKGAISPIPKPGELVRITASDCVNTGMYTISRCTCYDNDEKQKQLQWPNGNGCGAHLLDSSGLKTGFTCFRNNQWNCEGILFKWSNITSVNSIRCSCGGPSKHMKFTSFEYDLCTTCKKEK